MQPGEILKRIKPCNLEEPFVFISYSSQDNQRVWADVLRFQQMGYNVWLDEKNLDKTKASWRDDALEAIRDINCALLVYYVSRNSLVSQGCFKELDCTVEETTLATHNGPVKFVAVDVEPIDDIIKFQQLIFSEVRSNKDISKEEKTSRLITLRNCINQFFNSNNEKVRVKAYSLPNRKMDYYEEIVAAFPDETRIYEPKVEKTELKTVVKEKPAAAAPVETPRPMPTMKTAKKAPKAFSLEQAFADANQKLGKGSPNRFTAYKDISEKRMSNFRKAMCVSAGTEMTGIEGLWGFDEGHKEDGIIVTEDQLYSTAYLRNPVEYRKVIQVADGMLEGLLDITYEDQTHMNKCWFLAHGAPIIAFLQACIDQRG